MTPNPAHGPQRIQMHININLWNTFLFTHFNKLLQHPNYILYYLELILLFSDQSIPLEVELFVPMADIAEVIDS